MSDATQVPSTVGGTYVDPSAENILKPGTKIRDLYPLNMSQRYVLQRLSDKAWWVQSFNYDTVFYVGGEGVLVMDTLEGVYDNITAAIASVTDKPVTAVVYPQLPCRPHRRHRQVRRGRPGAGDFPADYRQRQDPAVHGAEHQFLPAAHGSAGLAPGQLRLRGLTVELHGFEWAVHTDDHAAGC